MPQSPLLLPVVMLPLLLRLPWKQSRMQRTSASRLAAVLSTHLSLVLKPVRLSADARNSGYAEALVTVDNYTSKAHTVIQVRTRDRKGLFYDSMRATKDLKVNVSYGKVCDLYHTAYGAENNNGRR